MAFLTDTAADAHAWNYTESRTPSSGNGLTPGGCTPSMSGNADHDVISGVEGELRSYGISVETLEQTDDRLEFTYITAFPGTSINHREMGRACNALIELADENDWTARPVEATVLRADDDVMGSWHLDPEWIDALLANELTETAFSTRVIDSVEAQ